VFQHWKDVSDLAKDFIDKTLVLDPISRITASSTLKHPWIVTNAATSSNKNLHRTISQNLLQRRSTRANRYVILAFIYAPPCTSF
jgi:protein serine kinase H